MGAYFGIPDDAERAIQSTRKAASDRDTYWKEVLVIHLGHNKDLLKLVVDGDIGKDYGNHTVLYRERFDQTNPKMWETQVRELINKYSPYEDKKPEDKIIISCNNPSCKQMLRVPSSRGELKITCPMCKTTFMFKPKEQLYTTLYFFDSQKISSDISSRYGAWAEGELLKAMSNILWPNGEWKGYTSIVQACHGDMIVDGYQILCNLIQSGTYNKFSIDMQGIHQNLLNNLKSNIMSIDLFIVGLSPLSNSHVKNINKSLRDLRYQGYYLGFLTFNGEHSIDYIVSQTNISLDYLLDLKNSSPFIYTSFLELSCCPYISDVGSKLNLISPLELTKGVENNSVICRGWLPNKEAFQEAGLQQGGLHNLQAIKREIKFDKNGQASENCCWNCAEFSITLSDTYWCNKDLAEVDRKDYCTYWCK